MFTVRTIKAIEVPRTRRKMVERHKLSNKMVRLLNHNIVCTAILAMKMLQSPAPIVANSLLVVESPALVKIDDE